MLTFVAILSCCPRTVNYSCRQVLLLWNLLILSGSSYYFISVNVGFTLLGPKKPEENAHRCALSRSDILKFHALFSKVKFKVSRIFNNVENHNIANYYSLQGSDPLPAHIFYLFFSTVIKFLHVFLIIQE